MKKQDFLTYSQTHELHKHFAFDGWHVNIYVEDEESYDKWHTLISTSTDKEANEAFIFFTNKFPKEKIRIVAPSHLAHSIVKEANA